MAVLIQSLIHETQEYMAVERKHSAEAKLIAENQAEEQIRHLKEQNAQLVRLLQQEKSKSERMKNDLVQRVSGLLNEFVAERDKSLEGAVARIKQENSQMESTLNDVTEQYSRKADDMLMRNQELGASFEKKGEQCKRLRDGAFKVIPAPLFLYALFKGHAVRQQCQRLGPRRFLEHANPRYNIPVNILHRDNPANTYAKLCKC
jgi:kinesin family member 11